MSEQRRLATRFDKLVDLVRSQPGMDRFLRNSDYKTLSSAASHRPVVMIQESWMCIITEPHSKPQIIPVHGITNKWVQEAVQTLRLSVRMSRSGLDNRGVRKRPAKDISSTYLEEYTVLAEIWYRIAQPLLTALAWTVSHFNVLF
jgi:hypothetical protein